MGLLFPLRVKCLLRLTPSFSLESACTGSTCHTSTTVLNPGTSVRGLTEKTNLPPKTGIVQRNNTSQRSFKRKTWKRQTEDPVFLAAG